MKHNLKRILGWAGVSASLVFSSLWAYWGAMENFHEGWYSASISENLFMLVFQYLLITIIFVLLAVIALRFKKIGLMLHGLVAAFCIWFFSGANILVLGPMIVVPIIGLGLMYFFGEPEPKKWAYRLIVAIPLIIILAISVPQAIKVSQRVNDGDFGIRIVEGQMFTLAWAPRGPGWPDAGTSWYEANEICRHLSEDGTTVMETEQNIWRLPTVEESVDAMMLHSQNSGGTWNAAEEKASYENAPDKETPLWDVHSKVIYYWTADTSPDDDQRAYIIVYHGEVFERVKTEGQGYLSFRAVKDVDRVNNRQ